MGRLFAGTPFDRPPTCERCGKLEAECRCEPVRPPPIPPEKQTARLSVEKRKRGKTVTLVSGLAAEATDLAELLTRLKTACGAGGTLAEGVLEIQGQHVERIRDTLQSIGYRVKP